MRKYPKTKEDRDAMSEMNAEPWMIEMLKKNPTYVWWGNFEESMAEDKNIWRSRVFYDNWTYFRHGKSGFGELDEVNEVVNFYFAIARGEKRCEACKEGEKECEVCGGREYIFTEDKATLALQLWIIHPPTGASRGVYIKSIAKDEVDEVIAYLKHAWGRNNARFNQLDGELLTNLHVTIEMEGGILHRVLADRPMKVTIVDYDTEGVGQDEIKTVLNEDAYIHSIKETEVKPELVAQIEKEAAM